MSRLLANHIRRTWAGPMWHGPSLSEALLGVTSVQAAARPLPEAHMIWELTLHTAVWAEIAAARLDERELDYPGAERDWEPVTDTAAEHWAAAIQRVEQAYRALADKTELLPAESLKVRVAGQDYTVRDMLHGVIEHGTYHCGQIMLLRRAQVS